jgi:hypothetical protein
MNWYYLQIVVCPPIRLLSVSMEMIHHVVSLLPRIIVTIQLNVVPTPGSILQPHMMEQISRYFLMET